MKIILGSDHAGYELKMFLIEHLKSKNYEILDKGSFSDQSVDYPDYSHAVANEVMSNEDSYGVLICGSANGVSISANRHKGIRCAICWEKEIASLARRHNNANVLALPARFISNTMAQDIIDVFLSTTFEGGRHEKRVKKIEI
jgi:ribose 5-phosphate isomerase B